MIRSIISTLLLLPMMVFSLGPKVNIRNILSVRSVLNRGLITCTECPVVSFNTTDNAVNVCSILYIDTWIWHSSMIRLFPWWLVKRQVPLLSRTLPANIISCRDRMTTSYWNGARAHFTGYSRLSMVMFIREWTRGGIFFLPHYCVTSISDVATTSTEAKCWITSAGLSSEYGHVSHYLAPIFLFVFFF